MTTTLHPPDMSGGVYGPGGAFADHARLVAAEEQCRARVEYVLIQLEGLHRLTVEDDGFCGGVCHGLREAARVIAQAFEVPPPRDAGQSEG